MQRVGRPPHRHALGDEDGLFAVLAAITGKKCFLVVAVQRRQPVQLGRQLDKVAPEAGDVVA